MQKNLIKKMIGMNFAMLLSIALFTTMVLAERGSNDPYISEPSYTTYDSGTDGKNDSVEVDFAIETNVTAYVYYIVDLYSNSDVLINENVSDTFELDNNVFDLEDVDMGSVSSDGYYYVTIELYNSTQSGDYLVDSWQSDSFYLYAKDTATPPTYNFKITASIPNAKKISQSITVNGEKYSVPYEIPAGEKVKIVVKATNNTQPVSGATVSMYTMGVYDPSTDTATLTAAGHFSPQKGNTNPQGEFITYYYAPNYNKNMYVFLYPEAEEGYNSNFSYIPVKVIPKSTSSPSTGVSTSNFLFQNILGVPLWIWLVVAGIIIVAVGGTVGILKSRKKKQPQIIPPPILEKEKETSEEKTPERTGEKEEGGLESIEKQLEKLKNMKEKGLISDEDYEKMKNKILENEIKK